MTLEIAPEALKNIEAIAQSLLRPISKAEM